MGDQITHGYYFEEFGANVFTSLSESDDFWWWPSKADHFGSGSGYSSVSSAAIFDGGDFTIYPDRRKVIERPRLVWSPGV